MTTSESTTSITYTDLATAGPAVTAVTGTIALVIITGQLWNPALNGIAFMACAVSSATTVAASDNDAITIDKSAASTIAPRISVAILYTGLTAGSNVFTTKYRTNDTANASNFKKRKIVVIPF